MTRDLEADLKLCEAVSDGPHVCERFCDSNFIATARTGWRETIRELLEARKRIADMETVIERYRAAMNRARRTVEELEDVLDE